MTTITLRTGAAATEVVSVGAALLRRQEQRVPSFWKSVLAAKAGSDRDG